MPLESDSSGVRLRAQGAGLGPACTRLSRGDPQSNGASYPSTAPCPQPSRLALKLASMGGVAGTLETLLPVVTAHSTDISPVRKRSPSTVLGTENDRCPETRQRTPASQSETGTPVTGTDGGPFSVTHQHASGWEQALPGGPPLPGGRRRRAAEQSAEARRPRASRCRTGPRCPWPR